MAKKDKKDKPQQQKVKNKRRSRMHKRRGSAGGASPTRFYPRYGDGIDTLCRALYDAIVKGKRPPENNGAFGDRNNVAS